MTRPEIDPERVAALLDGRLPAAEREALLAQLAESGDATLAALADAAAVTRELEAEGAGITRAGGARERARRRWFGPAVMALAAAGIVAAVALPLLRGRWSGDREGDAVAAYVEAIGPQASVPAGFETTPWSVTRSVTDVAPTNALAWRIGARLVDIEVAATSGDSVEAARLGAELVAMLEQAGVSAATRAAYEAPAAFARSGATTRAEAREEITRAIADTAGLRLGAWVEAARYAAAARSATFFVTPSSTASRESLRANESIDARAASMMADAARGTTLAAPQWDSIAIALQGVLVAK